MDPGGRRDVQQLPGSLGCAGARLAGLASELTLVKGAVVAYNKAIEVCRKAGDNATADFFKEILKDEEGHVDYLETQLSLIEQLTLPIYLTEQMKA